MTSRSLGVRGARLRDGVVSHLTYFLLVVLLLCACSTGRKVRQAFGGSLPIEVEIARLANDEAPIAVDLLFLYDDKLVADLLKMPASEWFQKREQYQKDHPAVIVQSWEWVPGQDVKLEPIKYRAGAKNVVLFADYHTEGEHRAVVGPPKPFTIILGERDLSVKVAE
jgi:type VI secretion system protein